ncbi:amino acid ABC transporter substrate-binding protein [Paradesulfitobacterium aromaticivorans]
MGKKLLAILLALVLLGAAGCSSSKQAGTTEKIIKIGTSVPLTGRLAAEGALYKQGYELWSETVNKKGGIKVGGDTYQVKLFLYDDKSDPETATKLTEKLITEDKVNFLLATATSGLVQATSSIAERYKTIMVAPIANAEALYKKGYKYIFGQLPRAGDNMSTILRMAKDYKLDIKSVAIVTPDDLFPLATTEGIKKEAEKDGIKATVIKYPKGSTDMSTVVSQVKGINADAVFQTSDYQEVIQFIRQMKEQKVSPKLMGFQDPPGMPDFVPNLGKDAEQLLGTAWWWENVPYQDPLFGSAQEFARLYKEKYNMTTVAYRPAAAAAGAEILQLAIEKAQSLDTEKVRQALLNTTFETLLMPTQFGTTEDGLTQINVKGLPVVLQIQNGKQVVLYPEKLKNADPVFPFQPWDKR